MMTKILLASAATLIVATPAMAQVAPPTGTTTVNYANNIGTTISNSDTFATNTALTGNVTLTGNIAVDSAANSQSDDKQVNDGNTVVFSSSRNSDGTLRANSNSTNTTGTVDVAGASGNVGVNSATGDYNIQSNVGTISASTGAATGTAGSWSKANTTALQSTTGTVYGGGMNVDGSLSTFADSNSAAVGNVDGAGNIGVNAAAGAFNSQQNIMTLASATDASLADASAGVLQATGGNLAQVEQSSNVTDAGTISGAGNIGVNIAAGVGNLQHNSLTVAASGF
jgi:hypothetical protein